MEVVLSPGRFGDEVPGAPFQNEEIREWSHVDRLTGMLERARVETGRWKTLNQGAARSYGKVIDSRERNSADGSVVQRARRQVEVFQCQGLGRSVQVVRASQWSSSRVTDSSTTSPLGLTSLTQKKNSAAIPERSAGSSRLNKLSPPSSLCRDEDISERLSTLLGSFAHHNSSSTVPLRRIDSKYATRTPISLPISKRSTSNEDLASHSEIHNNDLPAARKSLRESHNWIQSEEVKKKSQVRQKTIQDSVKKLEDDDRQNKIHEIIVEREETGDINLEHDESRDYTEKSRDSEYSDENDNSQSVIAIDQLRTNATNKAAIQLLPSSKANTTVVNLINNSDNSQPETTDIREDKRPHILSWLLPSSVVGEEAIRADGEETTTATTNTTTTTTTTTAAAAAAPTTSPRIDARIEEPTMPVSPGRSVKRVGFCKTEIHFAADSGKVNIVETDGKPPPTNKFRRRRRNSLTGVSSSKNLQIEKMPIAETKDSLDDNKSRTDPNLHRGHTTTVNLGSDILNNNEQRENGASSEPIIESMEKDKKSSLNSKNIEKEPRTSKNECNVVCTDADNNQVVLKVVTTHEPTIARVESDHIRKKIKGNGNVCASVKKEKRPNKCSTTSGKKSESHKEHTYVNVFTGSKRTPIYENYKIADLPTSIADNKTVASLTIDANSLMEKNAHVADTKIQGSSQPSNFSILKSRDIDVSNLERVKIAATAPGVNGNLSKGTESNGEKVENKKMRNKTKERKLSRNEGSSCNLTSHSATSSRERSSKQLAKSLTPRTSVSSSERSARHVSGNSIHGSGNNSSASKSWRDATSAKTTGKGDVSTKQKPIEVVYQTAVYNMKNEKLKKPQKGKESKGPRYLNELICGGKMKKPSDSKNCKTSSAVHHGANNKNALQPIKHWK